MKYLKIVLFFAILLQSCKSENRKESIISEDISITKDWIKVDSAYAEFRSNNIQNGNIIGTKSIVPDEITAIRISEAIFTAIYGYDIYESRPYTIECKNGIWIIEGTMPKKAKGGVPYIEIQKSDGKILKLTHGK